MADMVIHFYGDTPKEFTVLKSGAETLTVYKDEDNVITIARGRVYPMPKGHGRLIDADVLFQKVFDYWGEHNETTENWMMGMINNAPTIVPADRKVTP